MLKTAYRKGWTAALVGAFFAAAAFSAPAETYDIDKAHSAVTFKIRHLATNVPGSFADFSGTLVFDEEDVTRSSVEAVIQVASINTNNDGRDKHLRSPDFFDAEKYPVITFKSKRVEGFNKKFKVLGDFTMHGVTKEVTLIVDFLGKMAVSKDAPPKAGFSAMVEINRKDFGISYNKVLDAGGLVLGETVKISIDIEAAPPKKEPPPVPPPAADEKKEKKAS